MGTIAGPMTLFRSRLFAVATTLFFLSGMVGLGYELIWIRKAALIVGSSMVMSFSGAKLPVGLSVFAMLGFAGSVVGGFWLIYTTWRGNGRR